MTILDILAELNLVATPIDVDTLDFAWVKVSESRHQMNALQHGTGEYHVTIERDGTNWVVYAEEHEPEELATTGYQSTCKTLREAKVVATEFARFFQDTAWQNERDEDPED